MKSFMDKATIPTTYLTADEAAQRIQAAPKPTTLSIDPSWATAHKLNLGDAVELTPDDTGRVPQKGVLAGVSLTEFALDVTAPNGKTVRVHAPRLGFSVSAAKDSKL